MILSILLEVLQLHQIRLKVWEMEHQITRVNVSMTDLPILKLQFLQAQANLLEDHLDFYLCEQSFLLFGFLILYEPFFVE